MGKKPNFFIVGAPKCGTTALSEYLKEHPNVFMSTPKEPHYFASDMVYHREIENGDDYLALFDEAREEQTAIGEASVWYLYSKKAIQNIYTFNKNAKIVVMLRKPVEMVYSMHSQHLYSVGDDISDFEKAWDLEEERKQGRSIPKYILHRPNLYYSEIANYYTQLQNLYKYFPKEQVKVIIFDDFVKDTKTIFSDVITFLELPVYEKSSFQRVNENAVIRFPLIKKILKRESKFSKKLRETIKEVFGIKRIGFRDMVKKINSVKTKRIPMNSIIQKRVLMSYEQEVNNLSELLDIDLSHWNK